VSGLLCRGKIHTVEGLGVDEFADFIVDFHGCRKVPMCRFCLNMCLDTAESPRIDLVCGACGRQEFPVVTDYITWEELT
jgi:hypothetical protein